MFSTSFKILQYGYYFYSLDCSRDMTYLNTTLSVLNTICISQKHLISCSACLYWLLQKISLLRSKCACKAIIGRSVDIANRLLATDQSSYWKDAMLLEEVCIVVQKVAHFINVHIYPIPVTIHQLLSTRPRISLCHIHLEILEF